ncbi:YceI family protein [Nocardiopsis potens]|uniref:YceI family protein n=1 Tax=Nocardiopsis potens TaxID=1246458 RepID=UPI00034996B6|nr:YceI family protein [Nocardiopsis potens]
MTETSGAGLAQGTWRIDPAHSQVGFNVRHMMISRVRGRFDVFDAVLTVPEDPMAAQVRATIDASSIDTHNRQRDDHMRSADFFEVARYPEWTFASTGVRAAGDAFLLAGDLTIKGTTRPVELELEFNGTRRDPGGPLRAGFRAEGRIDRKDFGVDIEMPMDGGGVVVGDRINIEIDAEFILDQG